MAQPEHNDDEMVPREVFRTTIPGLTLILVALFLAPAGLKIVRGGPPSDAFGIAEVIALLIGAVAAVLLVVLRPRQS